MYVAVVVVFKKLYLIKNFFISKYSYHLLNKTCEAAGWRKEEKKVHWIFFFNLFCCKGLNDNKKKKRQINNNCRF